MKKPHRSLGEKEKGKKNTKLEAHLSIKNGFIALITLLAIFLYLVLSYGIRGGSSYARIPLLVCYVICGIPLVVGLGVKLLRFEFGSDQLAALSIVGSFLLGEYLAGVIVILMLSGGRFLEQFAVDRASGVLKVLAGRIPRVAHLKLHSSVEDIDLGAVEVGMPLVVFPHEICPADGVVIGGKSVMDESYLTGEPFLIPKTIGSPVISGAINGEDALTIRVVNKPEDSRYAKIMAVIKKCEEEKPRMRRLAEQIGAYFTPFAIAVATLAGIISGLPLRFLSVIIIATPCPLLLAVPVAIIGSISLCARRAIIVKDGRALEQVEKCRTAIFDKTGTLTYGKPRLQEEFYSSFFPPTLVFDSVASLERYSKHPLAVAFLEEAKKRKSKFIEVSEVHEPPGNGLWGKVGKRDLWITASSKLPDHIEGRDQMPKTSGGLECVVILEGKYAATFRFRDSPRKESRPFISHLASKHGIKNVLIVSGDRESEVRYLADQVGVSSVYAQCSPEMKLEIVKKETKKAKTLFVGDGINDAPAMMAATVGIAMGINTDVTAQAAQVVAMENSLIKVDEFMHIGKRLRKIALQSALIGILLSLTGMAVAATGKLTPVEGAVIQEIIDVLSILNALRAAFPPRVLKDF